MTGKVMPNPQGKLEFDVVLTKFNFLLVKIIKILETYGWLLNESECICLSKLFKESCLNLMWFMVRTSEFQIYSFVHVTINLKISIIFGMALKKSNASFNKELSAPNDFLFNSEFSSVLFSGNSIITR